MKKTYQSININAPIDDIWHVIHNFHDFSWAPEIITSCQPLGEKGGTEVGARRLLNNIYFETLIEINHQTHTIGFTLDDGPTPVSKHEVSNYISHIHLSPGTKDDSTFVEWSSTWESDSDAAIDYCHQIYVGLLEALACLLEHKQNV